MNIFFTQLAQRIQKFITFSAVLSLSVGLLIILTGTSIRAQVPTFFETFDNTLEGEVPEGWNWYSIGGDQGSNWVRGRYGFFGPKVMTSAMELALPGQVDEDWLVTPPITPKEGDHLIFDGGQEFVWDDWRSTFKILISTASANRSDFTNTLASFTEPEFPGYLYEESMVLDLSAYKGMPIHIAFVHSNPVTWDTEDPDAPMPTTETFYLDNVAVRPVQSLDYSGAEINGSYTSVIRLVQTNTTVIIGVIVRAAGDNGTANLTSMKFTTTGTSPIVKIKEAVVYTTYDVSFLSTQEDEGTVFADVYGKVTDPGQEFIVEGNQELKRGNNYFWLIYNLEGDENDLTYPYPEADATFETVTVKGVEHATTVPTTEGAHAVVPNIPPNDQYENAIELTPSSTPVRYGSYNYKASFETEFEKLAYCATPIYGSAKDGSNSVWWHFKAPSDGVITLDLSESNFNTLLLIQDSNFDQLACNKDIDEESFIFQSKITDFEVEAEKDYYIRVTGEGDFPGDVNAASGVVHMDFSFDLPMGFEHESDYELSSPYPNPTENTTQIDVKLKSPARVVLEIVDMTGRPVLDMDLGLMGAGIHKGLPLNVTHLQPGAYVLRMRGGNKKTDHQLIIKL